MRFLDDMLQSYWQYIEDVVTPKETEGTFNSMKMFWTYIKHNKNISSRNLIIKTGWQIISSGLAALFGFKLRRSLAMPSLVMVISGIV
jgi:hypothetical protein